MPGADGAGVLVQDAEWLGQRARVGALLTAVKRMAKIEIGGVALTFTPGQLEELAFRAKKRGHTVQQEMEAVVKRIEQELFWSGPAPVAPELV